METDGRIGHTWLCAAPWPRLPGKLARDAYAVRMNEPARELPELGAEDALHGAVNQLTIHGQRMPVIIPGSVIEALRDFPRILLAARNSGYLASLMGQAMPWAAPLSDGELDQFASAIADASSSGDHAPERLAAALREWRVLEEIETAQADIARGDLFRGREALAALRPRR